MASAERTEASDISFLLSKNKLTIIWHKQAMFPISFIHNRFSVDCFYKIAFTFQKKETNWGYYEDAETMQNDCLVKEWIMQ